MALRGYFIQYKFIIPDTLKHSSYTYQKLFRALYGYTQAVFKSSGKTYHYHRDGVLSGVPYIRPGKNCVIIPPGVFQKLIEFFKTGKNPAHAWRGKGEWKAVYYMNEKGIEEASALKAIEEMLDRKFVVTSSKEHEKIASELNVAASRSKGEIDPGYLNILLAEAQAVVGNEWFKAVYPRSEKLKAFYTSYKKLKGPSS